jgi:hypothetical protein
VQAECPLETRKLEQARGQAEIHCSPAPKAYGGYGKILVFDVGVLDTQPFEAAANENQPQATAVQGWLQPQPATVTAANSAAKGD